MGSVGDEGIDIELVGGGTCDGIPVCFVGPEPWARARNTRVVHPVRGLVAPVEPALPTGEDDDRDLGESGQLQTVFGTKVRTDDLGMMRR